MPPSIGIEMHEYALSDWARAVAADSVSAGLIVGRGGAVQAPKGRNGSKPDGRRRTIESTRTAMM